MHPRCSAVRCATRALTDCAWRLQFYIHLIFAAFFLAVDCARALALGARALAHDPQQGVDFVVSIGAVLALLPGLPRAFNVNVLRLLRLGYASCSARACLLAECSHARA